MKCPGFRGLGPHRGVPPGYHVLFGAEGRNKETVQHVLGLQHKFHRSSPHQMQPVNIGGGIPVRVVKGPVKLFGDHLDLFGVAGRDSQIKEPAGAIDKEPDQQETGQDRPGNFQRGVVGGARFRFVPRTMPVLDHEVNHGPDNRGEKHQRHPEDRHVQPVDVRGEGGRRTGEPVGPLVHRGCRIFQIEAGAGVGLGQQIEYGMDHRFDRRAQVSTGSVLRFLVAGAAFRRTQ